MKIDVLSLFPEMFNGILNESIIKSEEQANNPKMDLNKIKVREYHVGYQNTNIFVAYTN